MPKHVFQRVTDIRYFSMSYWLLALTIMFFYNGVFPFVADSRYGYHYKWRFQKWMCTLFLFCFRNFFEFIYMCLSVNWVYSVVNWIMKNGP